jgi:Holliday junction resolvase RusA-like endonuclease
MTPLRFTIPGPPRGKGRPRFKRQKVRAGEIVRTFTDRDTAAYENLVCLVARQARRGIGPFTGPVAVHLIFRLQRPKRPEHEYPSRPDLDNLVKAVLDGCNQAGIWVDDAQVVRIVSSKGYGDPCCEALIEELIA